jgi:hypothetical protein
MRHRWAALWMVLALCCVPDVLSGQSGGSRPGGQGSLKQNYPNPFNPQTWIPFRIGDPACQDPGKTYRATLRIYNLLSQVVAIPVVQGGSGSVAGGQSLENVPLPCGTYTAYWDGKYLGTEQEVASGIYFYQLIVDGKVVDSRKMLVAK